MKCVKEGCNGETAIINTLKDVDNTLRALKCKTCGEVFYTIEIQTFDEEDITRIKNSKQRYRKNKLEI